MLDIDANGCVFYEDGDDCYLIKYIGDSTVLTLPTDYNGKNYHIEEGAFAENESIVSVTISRGVVCIHGEAFYGCDNLESVIFTITEGWYATSDETATSGSTIDVSDASASANNLRYSYSCWKRNA